MLNRKGQSTLEYILIVGVVLAALIAVSFNLMKPAVESAVGKSADAITGAAANLGPGLGIKGQTAGQTPSTGQTQ